MSSPQAQPERIDPKEYPGGDKIEGVWHACAASGLRTVVLIPDFALSPLSEDAELALLQHCWYSFAPPLVLTSVLLLSVTAKVVLARKIDTISMPRNAICHGYYNGFHLYQ